MKFKKPKFLKHSWREISQLSDQKLSIEVEFINFIHSFVHSFIHLGIIYIPLFKIKSVIEE